jgi:hypothetical protein
MLELRSQYYRFRDIGRAGEARGRYIVGRMPKESHHASNRKSASWTICRNGHMFPVAVACRRIKKPLISCALEKRSLRCPSFSLHWTSAT